MRLLTVISAIVCMIPLCSRAGEKEKSPVLVYGLEWGAAMQFHTNTYGLYMSDAQSLIENRHKASTHHINGLVDIFAGIGYKRLELTLRCGYHGLAEDVSMLTGSARLSMFTTKTDRKGFFLCAEALGGIPIRNSDKRASSYALGAGYRIRISEHLGLDYKLSLVHSASHVNRIYDPYSNSYIEYESIRKAKQKITGLCLSTAIVF